MTAQSAEGTIQRLERVSVSNTVPLTSRKAAERLLNRLTSPVRVALLGMPGSGKTKLLNMIAGTPVVPDGVDLPTLKLSYGKAQKTVAILQDGTAKEFAGLAFDALRGLDAAFVQLFLPLPVLQRISLLEIVTDGSSDSTAAALSWAARRTDIALWCSQSFPETERRLWTQLPDAIKDHGFLVLTKADLLSGPKLSGLMESLEDVVAEEFFGLFPVATLQALASIRPDGSVDQKLRRGSGGGALLTEIFRHAERGHQGDVDSALLFLSRVAPAMQGAPVATTSADLPDADNAGEAPGTGARARENVAAAPEAEPNGPIFTRAFGFLRERAQDLSDVLAALDDDHAGGVLEHCVETAEHLAEILSAGEARDDALRRARDDIMDASDQIVLMQLENDQGSAEDAVTLLLQLRRDYETRLAA